LYYRLSAWTIKLPPLRQRREDILPLARHFVRQADPEADWNVPKGEGPELDERVQEYFLSREYPGNVRDLKNLVYRVVTRHVGPGPITIGDIPRDERPTAPCGRQNWCDDTVEQAVRQAIAAGTGLKEIRQAVEETAIRIAVDDEAGNLQRAAVKLGVTDRTLQKWRAEQRQQVCPKL
jgi:DNA-binding NtrC family response regulator